VLAEQAADLRGQLGDTSRRLVEAEALAQRLGIRVEASRRAGRSDAQVAPTEEARAATVAELTDLRRQAEDLRVAIADAEAERERVARGEPGDPRSHLRFVAHPQDPGLIRRSRILDVWSAVGIAAALVLLGALLIFEVAWWWVGLLAIFGGYAMIEALVRRRFLVLLLNVTVLLAVVAALILIGSHLLEAIALLLLAIGVLLLRDNVRELRTSIRPG
jgi:hypothetical protein